MVDDCAGRKRQSVGAFIFRKLILKKTAYIWGFIIIAPEKRGKGFGKQMLSQGSEIRFEIFGAKTVTLGVFANNESALGCYKAAGFVPVDTEKDCFEFNGEKWGLYNMKCEKIFENKEEVKNMKTA